MLSLSNKATKIAKEAVATNQKESNLRKEPVKGGRDWLEEMVTKQEILDRVGVVDPIIQKKVDTTLSNISYKNKTKMEVTDDIVGDLEKQIEKLRYQRVKMLQVSEYCVCFIRVKITLGSTKGSDKESC